MVIGVVVVVAIIRAVVGIVVILMCRSALFSLYLHYLLMH